MYHIISLCMRYSINAVKPGMPKFINIFRLRLVRVKVFSENRYFPEMLFSGKENVFMCLVAFQKMFRKIFSDVWLCSWKYHRKHIFYLLLTFSRLPNEYIISFIPQNTNKTQKKIIKSEQTKARSRSRSRSARLRSARSRSSLSRSHEASIAIAIKASRNCDRDRRFAQLRRSRSWSTPIDAMLVITRWCLGRLLIGVWFADRCLVPFVIGVWIVLSLVCSLFCSLSSFFLWLSLFYACEEDVWR